MTRSANRQRLRALVLSLALVSAIGLAAFVARDWLRQASSPTAVDHAASVEPASVPVASRPTLWVLAVGVSRYSDPQLRLRFAAADAHAVAEAFARQRGGPLYGDVKRLELLDEAVTRSSILKALDEFLGQAAPVDVGVIYMAGHGVRDAALGGYYFLPAAASAERPRIDGLEMDEFTRQLRLAHRNLQRLVVIADTCHAGAVARGSAPAQVGQDLAARLAPGEGLYILAAAKSGQHSREVDALGHGAFTQALLDGLQGAAADADGLIRVLGLASYTARVVPELTAQGQTPYLSILGGDLVLAAHPLRFAQVTPPPAFTPAAVAPAPVRERIAIMHFENLRPDPRHDWMQQALGEQFSTSLHQVPRFDVYDERMVRFLARGATDPIEASRRADMTKVVNGTYWVQNDRISITAHVKNTSPLQSVASSQIDGPVEQLADLSSRIVIDLLSQMQADLSRAEREQLLSRRTTDLAARKLLFDAERPRGKPLRAAPTPVPREGPAAALGRWLLGRLTLATAAFAADQADPEAELRATLEGYRQAFEREDVNALAQYYESFTPEQRAALEGYFANADDLHVEFTDVQIAIIGEQAAISFSREDRFVDHESDDAQQVVVRVTKLFGKTPTGWQIVPEP